MSVKDRMKSIIESDTPHRSRYVWLKQATGISGDIWKNFWFDRRAPDAFMLESIAKLFPQYAFWLATGITDIEHGHVAPPSREADHRCSTGIELPASTAFFRYQIKMADVDSADHFKKVVSAFDLELKNNSALAFAYVEFYKSSALIRNDAAHAFEACLSGLGKLRKARNKEIDSTFRRWRVSQDGVSTLLEV